MDFQSLLYAGPYAVFGVPGHLKLSGAAGTCLDLTVLDKTSGVSAGGRVDVQSIEPAAAVLASALAGVALADLEDAVLTMNGKDWIVRTHRFSPSPKGEADGEIF
jgi:hypothetical protein